MYFIVNGEDLLGKTIAFIHCAKFAEATVLATTDGGIMVIKQYDDGDDNEIEVLPSHVVQRHIFETDRNKWIADKLKELKVVGENEYEKLCEARRLAKEEAERKRIERQEQHERNEYLRLKAKFEGV